MQCLLIDTNQTIEDLNALCVAMQNTHIVLALTHRGLMPIAGANVYVFPYAQMSKTQLRVLRSVVSQTKQTFSAAFAHDVYVVHGNSQSKVDGACMLFAATCLLLHGLSTSCTTKYGHVSTKLEKRPLQYHVNATLFSIINACGLRKGVGYDVTRLLRKHGVSTGEGSL